MDYDVQVTALGAAVAAGVTAGVWPLGGKMGDITVYQPQIDAKERQRKTSRSVTFRHGSILHRQNVSLLKTASIGGHKAAENS